MMMRKTNGVLVAMALALAACGGDGEGGDEGGNKSAGSQRVSSGVASDKSASEATDGEAEQFCEAFVEYSQEQLTKEGCKAAGISGAISSYFFDGDIVEDCEDAVALCEDTATDATPSCEGSDAPSDDCTGTVGELETCYADYVDAQRALVDEYELPSCENMEAYLDELLEGDIDIEELANQETAVLDYSDIPSCEKLEEECLEL